MATSSTLSPRFLDDGSFPSFPRLPTEIRVKIWSQSLPVRILPIKAFSPLESSSNDDRFLCTEPPPVLLSVCREARYEALRFYVLISDTRKPSCPHESSSIGPGARFYFNPYLDTIFLDASRPVEWLRILRTIESHSRILSLALRNAHQCPHTFAIEVVAEKGVREMFVVGNFEEFGWVPEVRTLLPKATRSGGVMGGDGDYWGIVRCIESWECEILPKVTAVKEEFWIREGLGVVGRW